MTLKEARATGAKTYHGRPCRGCGGTEKYTASIKCVRCKRARDRDYNRRNSAAHVARSRAWADANLERQREHQRRCHLKKKYGITLEEYDALLLEQGGACAICGTTDTAPWDHFSVDHCHDTGKIRGLLCRACNTCIGQAGDSPDVLRNALRYLEAAA